MIDWSDHQRTRKCWEKQWGRFLLPWDFINGITSHLMYIMLLNPTHWQVVFKVPWPWGAHKCCRLNQYWECVLGPLGGQDLGLPAVDWIPHPLPPFLCQSPNPLGLVPLWGKTPESWLPLLPPLEDTQSCYLHTRKRVLTRLLASRTVRRFMLSPPV